MSATDRPPRSLEPLLAHPEHAGVYHLPHSGSAQLEREFFPEGRGGRRFLFWGIRYLLIL